MCGHLPFWVTVDNPEAGIAGQMTHDFREDHGTNPDTAPDFIVGILLGPLAEEAPGWPIEWRLDPDSPDNDARQIARLAEYLDLDKDRYDWLVREAIHISLTKEFRHLVNVLAYALERLDELDQEQIRFLVGEDVCRRYGIAPATEEAAWSTSQ